MYAEERRREIVERARGEGRVEVGRLAELFGVSQETVRRDLSELERAGVLRRTHGGAMPVERVRFEPEVGERMATMASEKARIAEAALGFVPDRGAVLLDAGTTTAALAERLPENRNLTVVTNCLPVASNLAARSSMSVIMVGGRVRGRTLAAVEDLAVRSLEDFSPDVAFVATNGFTLRYGLTTPDPAEAAVKRAMVRGARRVVLVADHTKFGQEHFVRFARAEEIDIVVTDSGLDGVTVRELQESGLEVVCA